MCVRADLYAALTAKLGPDPLREDADAEAVWARMQASRKPVGLVLMDQSMIAGIGNIYRAEILFKARAARPARGRGSPRRASARSALRETEGVCMLRIFFRMKQSRSECPFLSSFHREKKQQQVHWGGPPGGRRACTPSRRPTRWSAARSSASGRTRWSCCGAASRAAPS